MKFVLFFTSIALGQGAILKSVGVSFGPQNCVSLTRSSGGSCVLTTSCEGMDTSITEFAFDCINQNVVRHSFGFGGFESSEEFDTEVKCGRCATVSQQHQSEAAAPVKKVQANLEPTPVHLVPKSEPQVVEAKVAAAPQEVIPGAIVLNRKANTKIPLQAQLLPFSGKDSLTGGSTRKERPLVVKYGPAGCISTWKSPKGHCIMKTDCESEPKNGPGYKDYEFGLVCVDKNGMPVKHLFGKDSFDPQETFDTLIKCDQCLGLEDIPDTVALAGEVASMAKDVNNLKDVMKNISVNVMMLNNKVFSQAAPGPSPGPAPAPAVPAQPAKFLVHGAVSHHKHHRGNLRRSHRRHHRRHRREEDYDDDDDQDDQDDDRREDREDREERDDDNSEEEPKTGAVDAVNAAAVQMQQAQVAKDAAQAQVRYIPMNTVSANVAQMSTASSASDDDDADDGSDED